MYSKSLLILILTIHLSSAYSKDKNPSQLFSKQAWEKAANRLEILNSGSSYPVKISFSMFRVGPLQLSLEERSIGKPTSLSDITKKILTKDFTGQDLRHAHELAKELSWFKAPPRNNVVVLFSVGVYINTEGEERMMGYNLDFNGGDQVPADIMSQLRAYSPNRKFNFDSGDRKANDAALDEFVSFMGKILYPSLNNYIVLNGTKYYSGDVAYLPFTDSHCVDISAFHHTGLRFDNKLTRWSEATSAGSAPVSLKPRDESRASTLNYCQREPSQTLYGSLITATQDEATIAIRLVKVGVSFEKNVNDPYGFDENSVQAYPTYGTSPSAGSPWKSIPATNEPVPVNFVVAPAEARELISFSVKDNLNFKITDVSNSTLYISGSKHKGQTTVVPVIGGVEFAHRLFVIAFTMKTHYLTVIQLHEENDDEQLVEMGGITPSSKTPVVGWGGNKFVDTKPGGDDKLVVKRSATFIEAGKNKRCDTEANNKNTMTAGPWGSSIDNFDVAALERYLNLVYKPSMVKIEIVNAYDKTINYDFNRDGYLEYVGEEEAALPAALSETPVNTMHSVLFIANLAPDARLGGFAWISRNYSVVRSFTVNYMEHNDATIDVRLYPLSAYVLLPISSAHEIGHAVFGLVHPWEEFDGYTRDPKNIMEHGQAPERRFRKYQWDIIQKE